MNGDFLGETSSPSPLDSIAGVTNPVTNTGSGFWAGLGSAISGLTNVATATASVINATNKPAAAVSPTSQVRGVQTPANNGTASATGLSATLGKFTPWILGTVIIGVALWAATKLFGKKKGG